MNHLTLSPALGWPVGLAVAVAMLACAVAQIVLHIRRRGQSDETVWACVRRSLTCMLVSVMALTPSIVSSTNSRAINTTDVVEVTVEHLDPALIDHLVQRITTEVPGINRVLYDYTPKPPATVELE